MGGRQTVLALASVLAASVALTLPDTGATRDGWRDPHSAASKPRGCATRGEGTIVANEWARVFIASRDPDKDGEYFGCAYGRKRDWRLGYNVISTSGSRAEFFQLKGALVAFDQEECGNYCDFVAKSVDLESGRTLHTISGTADLLSLYLTDLGSLALLNKTSYPWESPTTYAVTKVERRGTTVLASGPDIDPGSLALGYDRVYWRQGDEAKSAPID